jgi:regulatory protein
MKKIIVEIKSTRVKGRVDLVFEDGTVLNVGRAVVEAAGLRPMQEIEPDYLDKITKEEEYKRGFEAALTYLEYRPRSEAELRQYLRLKQRLGEESIRAITDKLTEMQLIDDKTFAETWLKDRISFKPKSRLMITRELLQKGIDYDTAREATDGVDDEESAYKAGLKKAKLLKNEDRAEFARRLTAYLGRRGFAGDVVRATIARLWHDICDN